MRLLLELVGGRNGDACLVAATHSHGLLLPLSLPSAAARSLALPLPSPTLAALEGEYWSAMANGTGEPFDAFLGDLSPRVFDYTQCAEATSNTFWVGTPYDELARDYVASLVNHAFASPLLNGAFGDPRPALPLTSPLTKQNTVAVSAMESAGWMEVLALEEVRCAQRGPCPSPSKRGTFTPFEWVHARSFCTTPESPR